MKLSNRSFRRAIDGGVPLMRTKRDGSRCSRVAEMRNTTESAFPVPAVKNPAGLRRWVIEGLKSAYRGYDCATHLESSWSMNTCFAGDAVILEMLQTGKFIPYVMHSWLSFYSTMLDKNLEDQRRVLGIIEQHYRHWQMTTGDSVALVERVYRDIRCEEGVNRFVMVTKLAWLMRCEDVVIYDRLVGLALDRLIDEKLIDFCYWVPADPKSRGDEQRVKEIIDGYRQVDLAVRAIARVAEKELDDYLTSAPNLPPALRNNRLRLVDKLLWGVGSDIDAKDREGRRKQRALRRAQA